MKYLGEILLAEMHITTSDWVVIFIGLLTIIATFLVYLLTKQSSEKALTYDFTAAQIVNLKHDFNSRLKIIFDDLPIGKASIVSLTVKNSGGSPIQRADFDGPLKFHFAGSEGILDSQISDRHPSSLIVQTNILPDDGEANASLRIDPLLLNKGDQFTLLALVSGFGNKIEADGRIAGVSDVERKRTDKSKSTFLPVTAAVIASTAFGAGIGSTTLRHLLGTDILAKDVSQVLFAAVVSGLMAIAIKASLKTK